MQDLTFYRTPPSPLPREKLAEKGSTALSDQELMAVMLGSGCAGMPVAELAGYGLDTIEKIQKNQPIPVVKGLGKAKISLLLAAHEFFRRRYAPAHWKILGPKDVYPLLIHYADRAQENFIAITLNGAHEVIRIRPISVGLVNRTIVHPREVFSIAISDMAASLLVAHNHPSGNLTPSREDREVTSRLLDAGRLLGIPLLDHVVFSNEGYFSFQESGDLG